ncbi:type IV pilus assembly protein PilW [Halopseudomonas sabulinigri]|uniref:Type IV pilus assembly protein PilW n=1 Tax=Halopseudomonas sabulinigri TaxID=472181 RepID=A0A1H1R248_9GAMM|nr:type IV pilus assembly protein PilW [Halopseudomonas sabulinigri]
MKGGVVSKYKRWLNTPTSFKSRGLALVELMIALVLGLVIIGAVTGIMLSNTQSFRTNRGLSQLQDGARVGYELLARDIRQAGNMPCGNDIPVVNILNPAQTNNVPWYYDWDNAFIGYDGDSALANVDNQIADTESLVMLSGDAGGVYVEDYDTSNNSANFTVGTASGNAHGLLNGEVLMVCNESQGTIFQMSNGQGNNADKLVVNTGNSQSPGNCTKGLGEIIPGNNANQPCNTNGNQGPYGHNSVIAKLTATAWYIGDNGRAGEGGRSLYMARLSNNAGAGDVQQIEIAAGVTSMALRYRLADTSDFIDASTVGNRWADVNAVEVTLTLLTQDQNISTDTTVDEGRLGRALTSVVAIRNRSL